MITIKNFMELVDYKITEGSTYGWQCYGDNAYCLDSWNGEHDGHSLSINFDTRTQEVYEVQVHDFQRNRAYRMINPEYAKKHRKESKRREVNPNEAWDEVDYVDLETTDDFLEKARAIVSGQDYDTRIQVPVDFTDEDLLAYMKLAHERDITFNQLVEEALVLAIADYDRDPDSMKHRAKQWKKVHVTNTDNPIDFPKG